VGVTGAQYDKALITIEQKFGSTIQTLDFVLYLKHFKDYFNKNPPVTIESSTNFFDSVLTRLGGLEDSLSKSNLSEHKNQRAGIAKVRDILNSTIETHLCQKPSMFGGCVSEHCFAQLVNGRCPFHSGDFIINRRSEMNVINKPILTSRYSSDRKLPIGRYTVISCGKDIWNNTDTYFVTLISTTSNKTHYVRSGAIFKQVLDKVMSGPIQPPRQFDIEMCGEKYKNRTTGRRSADIWNFEDININIDRL
jgi:hypothetical protein